MEDPHLPSSLALLGGVPASAGAAGMWQLQTGVSDAVCSMVPELDSGPEVHCETKTQFFNIKKKD